MQGWETGAGGAGYAIGQDLHKSKGSPGRRSPTNQLGGMGKVGGMMTKSNRSRASSRLKSAQGKVLRAIRVQRRMSEVREVRQNARTNWQKGANKIASVLGFKWLGTEAVSKRKRSIFGNVRGGAIIDDASMPRVSLHDTPEGDQSARPRRGSNSTVTSMTLSQRPAAPVIKKVVDPFASEVAEQKRKIHVRQTAADVEKTLKKKAVKKKWKTGVSKVRKFVRVVRLSYSDTFTGENKVSLTDLLGRLRNHYDPDGIHADAHDGQHEFYTDLALLQRESLKHDPRVRRILDFIWNATDRDGNGTIDKEEYMIMCKKVYRAIVDDTDTPEADAEIRKIAEEDWDADRQGHDHLDYERFTRAWFQLADHWTHDLTPESYETFLGNIFNTLTERDADGKIVWKDDSKIHHYDPEATDEDRNKLVEGGFQDKEIPKKKKKKKKMNVAGMNDEEMAEYLRRKALRKKESQGGKVIFAQEGMMNRDLRLAKITSRNGLYIGSVVPPPREFDDVLTHKNVQKSAFMRIPIQGGAGVYQRGYNSDKKSVTMAGQGFGKTYPKELRQSLSVGKLAPVLSEEAKAETDYMLQRLWSSSPIGGGGNGRPAGSPGGPSGWLAHFSRADTVDEDLESRIEQSTREQSGAGGGFSKPEETYSSSVQVRRPVTAGPRRTPKRMKEQKQQLPISATDSATDLTATDLTATDLTATDLTNTSNMRPQSAPASRKKRRPKSATPETTLSSSGSNVDLLRTSSFKTSTINTIEDTAAANTSTSTTPSNTNDSIKKSDKKKRKKKKSASTKMLERPSSAIGGSSSRKSLKNQKTKRRKRPMSASASRSRMGRRKTKPSSLAHLENALVPETDIDPGSMSRQRKRPKSAQNIKRNRRTLDGSHMFKTSRNEMDEVINDSISVKVGKKSKIKSKTKGVPKVTLLRLNISCRKKDVASVLNAMGVDVPLEDIRMTVPHAISGHRKARVYFRRSYVEYKRAVQMLTIVQRSVDVAGTTPIFDGGQTTESNDDTSAEVLQRNESRKNEVTVISKLRIPKLLRKIRRPQSAHR